MKNTHKLENSGPESGGTPYLKRTPILHAQSSCRVKKNQLSTVQQYKTDLPKRTHDGAQLLGGDGAVTIFVEEREGLFEFGNLLFSQLVSLIRIRKIKEV